MVEKRLEVCKDDCMLKYVYEKFPICIMFLITPVSLYTSIKNHRY
jgi:hypothetical protein